MSAVPEPGAQVPTDADAVGLGPEAMQAIARDAMAQAADAAAAGSGAGPQSSDVQPPPAMPPPGAALPSGWIEETDANSGMPIYFNTGTGEIMFERPGAGPPPEDPPPPYPAPAPASATGAGSDHAHAGPPSGSATSSAIGAPRAALHSAPRSSAARLGQIRTQVTETLFGSAGTTVTAGAGSQPRRLTPCTVRGAGPWYVDMQAVPHPRFRELPALGPFPTEAAARAAARHEAPPVWVDEDHCNRCRQGFGLLQRRTHCRNCGYSMCRGCCKTWPRAALPALYPKDGESASRICLGCNANVDAFRAALLAGDTDAARRAYADGRANLNLRCFLPATSDGEGARGGAVLLPVHLAAVANSLATLKWLAEEEHCPVVGPDAMSLGKPSKSVLRVAIEAQATDVLQWLIGADDAAPHTGVPMPMPMNTGCATAAVHRALEGALREGYRQRALLNTALEAAAARGATVSRTASGASAGASPQVPAAASGAEDNECVICLAAPKECVLIDCGHACVCEQCAGAVALCPLCRAPIQRYIRMYTG